MSGGSLSECGEPPALFVGEGEMIARIRAMEWSATPVGPMQGWPQSLCTAVSIMLESRHPMLIWWGPEFTMFYNDAFMALAGSKHPSGLGQRGSEMFADIWRTIGPMLNGVLSSGQATWVDDQLLIMNRHGLEEETYWTYSYSPIRDIDARVQVPVLLLSARAGQEAAVEGLDAGADDYLVKPFSAEELLARVRLNLELARLRSHESAWRSTLISAMQDGMFVADLDGTVVEVNGAFAGILGYGATGLPYVSPHPWWPDPVQEPEEFTQVRDTLDAALQRGSGGGGRR